MKCECNLQNRGIVASLYKKYYNDLKLYLLSYTRNVMAAEDMLQDLFVKVMGIDVITEVSSRSLLFLMAKRMIIDDMRHKAFASKYESVFDMEMDAISEESVVKKIEAADILSFERKHVAEMPKKRAHIYNMYKHEEKSIHEIAELLNLSKRTVETQIYLSTKEMKAYLTKII